MKPSIVQSQVQALIEEKFQNLDVQKASHGLLSISNRNSHETVSLQSKCSKDYLTTHESVKEEIFQSNLRAIGWWTINTMSPSNLWLFVLFGFEERSTDYILVPRSDLLNRLESNHLVRNVSNLVHSHLCVTNHDECWEIRNLPKEERRQIAQGKYRGANGRNFTRWLNDRTPLEVLDKREKP